MANYSCMTIIRYKFFSGQSHLKKRGEQMGITRKLVYCRVFKFTFESFFVNKESKLTLNSNLRNNISQKIYNRLPFKTSN